MAETVVFAEQEISGFHLNELYGLYYQYISPAPFAAVVGDTYRVSWDGEIYECVAFDVSALVPGMVGLGNGSAFGLPGNNEPFIIGVGEADINFFVMDANDQSEKHTVAIYMITEGQLEVTLKDRSGADITYPVENGIRLFKPDGTSKVFVDSDSVPEAVGVSVALDFSGGDMEVTPEKGTVFSKVAIPVPDGLVPENIAEGVTIAGIAGALVASSGSDIKVVAKEVLGNAFSTTKTIAHNLGVVPDFIAVWVANTTAYAISGSSSTYKGKLYGCIYFSDAMATKYPGLVGNKTVQIYCNSDTLTASPSGVTVTETSVTFTQSPATSASYNILAIAGLT